MKRLTSRERFEAAFKRKYGQYAERYLKRDGTLYVVKWAYDQWLGWQLHEADTRKGVKP